MAKVPNGIETLPKISIASLGCTNVTDDRQTDGRTVVAQEIPQDHNERTGGCIAHARNGYIS